MSNPQNILIITGLAILWAARVVCLFAAAYLVYSALTMFLFVDPFLTACSVCVLAMWVCFQAWLHIKRKNLDKQQ